MGTWALEHDPGKTGGVYQLVNFNGDLFGWVYSGTGSGVWRRTPPNWTATIPPGGYSARGAIFDGKMWWGTDPAGGQGGRRISRSDDGINWTLDLDLGTGCSYSHWSAMGADVNYLYAAGTLICDVGGTPFWRRDTLGNWVSTPPAMGEVSHSYDAIRFDNVIYCSSPVTNVRYYRVAAWANEPTLNGYPGVFFTEYAGQLWAVSSDGPIWIKTASGWTVEMAAIGGAWGFSGAISVGGDGDLYVTANDGVNSRVYVRSGGSWSLHSTIASELFTAAATDDNGDLFAATSSCEFWAYTFNYGLTGPGAGGTPGLGTPPQAIDTDGDGDAIYVGLYDGGDPILIKAALPLAEDTVGDVVYNPGAGDSINIQTSKFVGGFLVASGHFGANVQVQQSEDAGVTLAQIDPGTWGVNRAQPIALDPNDEGHILVALDGVDDLMEYTGAGTSWNTLDAALAFDVGAMAIYDLNPDEIFIGRDAAGADVVLYSPNNGVDWEDITLLMTAPGAIANIEVV